MIEFSVLNGVFLMSFYFAGNVHFLESESIPEISGFFFFKDKSGLANLKYWLVIK